MMLQGMQQQAAAAGMPGSLQVAASNLQSPPNSAGVPTTGPGQPGFVLLPQGGGR